MCGGERNILQYVLQDETRALLEEFSRIDEMQTEMERLRAENRELRKFFGGSGDSLGSEEQSREH